MRARVRVRGPRTPFEKGRWDLLFEREVLGPRRRHGEILRYRYGGIRLLITVCDVDGKRSPTFYTPDWFVLFPDGAVELWEVKGFWHRDARLKVKLAAEAWPEFRFVAWTRQTKKEGGGWRSEVFGP